MSRQLELPFTDSIRDAKRQKQYQKVASRAEYAAGNQVKDADIVASRLGRLTSACYLAFGVCFDEIDVLTCRQRQMCKQEPRGGAGDVWQV